MSSLGGLIKNVENKIEIAVVGIYQKFEKKFEDQDKINEDLRRRDQETKLQLRSIMESINQIKNPGMGSKRKLEDSDYPMVSGSSTLYFMIK